jgi:hypothetical protein
MVRIAIPIVCSSPISTKLSGYAYQPKIGAASFSLKLSDFTTVCHLK